MAAHASVRCLSGSKFLCGGDGETDSEEMACHILVWPMVIFWIARPDAAHIKVQMRRRRPLELFVQMTNHHVLVELCLEPALVSCGERDLQKLVLISNISSRISGVRP